MAAAPGAGAADVPGWEELASATFHGLEEPGGEFTLRDGQWLGAPYAPGAASRPRVSLVRGFHASGDLDGDGLAEAVVLLASHGGGSGEFVYLAVAARRDGQLRNVATSLLGDRVDLVEGAVREGRIVLKVVQAGPGDPMCCPGEVATRTFRLAGETLQEQAAVEPPARLSVSILGGQEWVLRAWRSGEDAPAQPRVTLGFKDGHLSGSSGCNRYFVSVRDGDAAGDVSVGPVAGTLMACPDVEQAVEQRFLDQLGRVKKLEFNAGRLWLVFESDGARSAMEFERATPAD